METILKYRGRLITATEVAFLRQLIAANPGLSRRALSDQVCAAWAWRQANGAPRAMVCRGLMLQLHRAGHIELPPVRRKPPNPLGRRLAERARPAPEAVDRTPLATTLDRLQPLELVQVRRTPEERLFNSLLDQYHYLGYTQPVGEHLKYIVYARERPVACLGWSSAPRHLAPRDRFIGWPAPARRQNIRFLAYNTRFLILPFVQVPHLASHLLGRLARQLPRDWERLYGHAVYYLETFVDPARFRGTCYFAANWTELGLTTGRGKDDQTGQPNRSLKQVLGYPLRQDFRQLLAEVD